MLGPSGCGKTTTLRMIAGFEQPTEGEIRLEGDDVSRVPPYKRNVNTVFQQYALFPHLTVEANVAFGLQAKKVAKPEIAKRVAELLEVVRLGGLRPAQAGPALRRPAAACRAGPRARQLPERAPPRRAPRRARPQAPAGDAARAQADPARGRHHVRVRDPRPGRGAHDERPDRGHERRAGRADREPGGDLPPARVGVRRRLHRHGEPAAGHRSGRRRGERATASLGDGSVVDAPAVEGLERGDARDVHDPTGADAPRGRWRRRVSRRRSWTSCSRARSCASSSRPTDDATLVAHVGPDDDLPLLRPGDPVRVVWDTDGGRLLRRTEQVVSAPADEPPMKETR